MVLTAMAPVPTTVCKGVRGERPRRIPVDSVWVQERLVRDGESLWQQDPVWRDMVDSLRDFPDGLEVLEVCGGVGSAFSGFTSCLGQRRGRVIMAGHFDTDERLAEAMLHMHGNHDALFLGAAGDILTRPVEDFPSCHVLVSGPPCPPWSSKGKCLSFDDPRAAVFWKVVDIVRHQGQQDQLMFFILENVPGLLKRHNGVSEAPVTILVKALQDTLPDFDLEILLLNSLDFGLPQSRARVYIVGRRRELFPRGQPPPPRIFAGRVQLRDILWPAAACAGKLYTPIQEQNLRDFKHKYRHWMTDPGQRGLFMVVDISRTPSDRTTWGNSPHEPDVVECLTASGPALHVFALGEGQGELSVDRPIMPGERGLLQGQSQDLVNAVDGVPDIHQKRMFGNAMSVPVVGSVGGRMLQALLRSHDPATLAALLQRKPRIAADPSGHVVSVPDDSAQPAASDTRSASTSSGLPHDAAGSAEDHFCISSISSIARTSGITSSWSMSGSNGINITGSCRSITSISMGISINSISRLNCANSSPVDDSTTFHICN